MSKAVERVRFGSHGQGSLVKYADGPNWYSCYSVRGKEHRESSGSPDMKVARRFNRRAHRHCACGASRQVQEGVTAMPIVTLSHEIGAGGPEIGKNLAERLGLHLCRPGTHLGGSAAQRPARGEALGSG